MKIFHFFFAVKKRLSKTPAQDRLQGVAVQLQITSRTKDRSRNVTEQLRKATPAQSRLKKLTSIIVNVSETIQRTVKPKTVADLNKPKVATVRDFSHLANKPLQAFISTQSSASCKIETNVANSTDEIPSLFASRTPGQERLNRLRHCHPDNNGSTSNESAQHALSVIRTEFGLSGDTQSSDNSPQNTSTSKMDEDEPMDWEPCDIFDEVENGVVNEFIKPYIIPDTNVLLDELSCVRASIHNGQSIIRFNVGKDLNLKLFFFSSILKQIPSTTF